jgi:hypothetical protein
MLVAALRWADHLSKEPYHLRKKDYKTEEEAKTNEQEPRTDRWMNIFLFLVFLINHNTQETNFFISSGKLLAYGIYTLLALLEC